MSSFLMIKHDQTNRLQFHTYTKSFPFNTVINFDTPLLNNNFHFQTPLHWTKETGLWHRKESIESYINQKTCEKHSTVLSLFTTYNKIPGIKSSLISKRKWISFSLLNLSSFSLLPAFRRDERGCQICRFFFYHGERCHWRETLGALNDLFNNTILSLVVDRLTDSLHKNPCLHANREKNDLTLNLHLVGQHIKMHLIPDQHSTWSANDPCTQMMGLRWGIGPWKRCQWILCVNRLIHLYRHVQAPYLRKKPIETIKWSSERLFHICVINFIREIGLYLTKFIATHILQVWYFRVIEVYTT